MNGVRTHADEPGLAEAGQKPEADLLKAYAHRLRLDRKAAERIGSRNRLVDLLATVLLTRFDRLESSLILSSRYEGRRGSINDMKLEVLEDDEDEEDEEGEEGCVSKGPLIKRAGLCAGLKRVLWIERDIAGLWSTDGRMRCGQFNVL